MSWPYHPDLLARAVPRYTSYPTAADFAGDVGADELERAMGAAHGALSLYVHIPYCERICWYCGCNTGSAGRTKRLAGYIESLEEEIGLVAARLPADARVARIAFGGGSPNAIAPVQFVRLVDRLLLAFRADRPQFSVELDPRAFTFEWGAVLGAVGIGHVSLGVQTFDTAVQARIGRVQPHAMIAATVDRLRSVGVRSINFDLMYGLPGQGLDTLAATLDATLALRPERIALFGYAHVPDLIPRQRQIGAADLPDAALRFAMAAAGFDRLTAAGYVPVGFDHFALPHDSMAVAAEGGMLRRNFQGFTDDAAERLVGLGASAIGGFPDLIVQNEKNAGRYRMRVSQGLLPVERGIRRSADDRQRAMAIEDILCHRPAEIAPLMDNGVAAGLAPFLDRGIAMLARGELIPTDATRPYARSIAALFDRYRADSPRSFSSAV